VVKLGFHVSISGSIDLAVDQAIRLRCDTFQIFTRNPRSWATRPFRDGEVEAFREKRIQAGLEPVYSHMPYILNLASPDDEIYSRSIDSLSMELGRCAALGVPMLVTHLGSHMGYGLERGISRIVGALNRALDADDSDVVILLENGSGSRNGVGSTFEEISGILEGVEHPERVAACLDTCHAFVAGFEINEQKGLDEALSSFDDTIGLDRLRLVHLNDSVGGLGTGVDHHEHIGLGGIGLEGFRLIVGSRLSKAPMVMETPIDDRRTDKENMDAVRGLTSELNVT